MTDRELLEMAAKAAGYDTTHRMNAERLQMIPPVDSLLIRDSAGEIRHTAWNPLANNGDALRLAVKTGAVIQPKGLGVEVWVFESRVSSGVVEYGDDPYTATRRAIVRAAAAIGSAM